MRLLLRFGAFVDLLRAIHCNDNVAAVHLDVGFRQRVSYMSEALTIMLLRDLLIGSIDCLAEHGPITLRHS